MPSKHGKWAPLLGEEPGRSGTRDLVLLYDGRTLSTHGPDACLGPHCCIHNPSDRPLRDAPLNWRTPDGFIDFKPAHMERICSHGVGHPDPDGLAAMISEDAEMCSWHGCDDTARGRRPNISAGVHVEARERRCCRVRHRW